MMLRRLVGSAGPLVPRPARSYQESTQLRARKWEFTLSALVSLFTALHWVCKRSFTPKAYLLAGLALKSSPLGRMGRSRSRSRSRDRRRDSSRDRRRKSRSRSRSRSRWDLRHMQVQHLHCVRCLV